MGVGWQSGVLRQVAGCGGVWWIGGARLKLMKVTGGGPYAVKIVPHSSWLLITQHGCCVMQGTGGGLVEQSRAACMMHAVFITRHVLPVATTDSAAYMCALCLLHAGKLLCPPRCQVVSEGHE